MICKYKDKRVCTKGLYGQRPSDGVCTHICKERDTTGLPHLTTMAANFAKATIDHAKDWFRNRSDDDTEKLKEICRQCEYYTTIKDEPRCKKCGCKLNIKTRWNSATCPIDKWNLNEVAFVCCVAHIGDLMCVEPFIRYYHSLCPEKKIVIRSNWPEMFSEHPDISISMGCDGQSYPTYNAPTLWYSIDPTDHITQWMPKFNKMTIPDTFDVRPRLYLNEEKCKVFADSIGLPQKYVTIAPHATTSTREWDWEKWADVVENLNLMGYKTVQLGGRNHKLIDGVDLDLSGHTNLQEAGYVIKQGDFFLGADSGLSHIAVAVGKKSVVTFGTHRENNLQHNGYTYSVIGKTNKLDCWECEKHRFKWDCSINPLDACMSFTVDEVMEQVRKVVEDIKNERN